MAQTALIAAFLAGLLGGLHCMAMCGGYVGALAAAPVNGPKPILHGRALLVRHAVPNLARLSSYVALGALFGAAGGSALGAQWPAVQRGLYVVANLLLFALAVAVASGRSPFAVLERAGLALYRRILPAAGRLGRGRGLAPRVALGFLWGLTPCGLVYSVLPVAMLAGSAADGAWIMLAFGVGTLPNLLAAGYVAGRSSGWLQAPGWRLAAAAVIAAFALAGLYRALLVPEALAHGPFCIVPP
ncbi:MAG: sulfite exporter TauE/SafE family protein [Betaproteobacteria bacterium]|jgi:sulfite exporter TauE/SafE|nr:sulfite exporter TauE/SafE family protein [Betaproteobacteria bacterium]MDH5286197.1 sulfite exporter TauE/SafE family protein [Betaproteobacteria bacterium]